MNHNKQTIIDMISMEISNALIACEYNRNASDGDVDKIDAQISSYIKRVELLRNIRTQLENEFTIVHYDPR